MVVALSVCSSNTLIVGAIIVDAGTTSNQDSGENVGAIIVDTG